MTNDFPGHEWLGKWEMIQIELGTALMGGGEICSGMQHTSKDTRWHPLSAVLHWSSTPPCLPPWRQNQTSKEWKEPAPSFIVMANDLDHLLQIWKYHFIFHYLCNAWLKGRKGHSSGSYCQLVFQEVTSLIFASGSYCQLVFQEVTFMSTC